MPPTRHAPPSRPLHSRLSLGDAHNSVAAAVVFLMGMTSGVVASSCMVSHVTCDGSARVMVVMRGV